MMPWLKWIAVAMCVLISAAALSALAWKRSATSAVAIAETLTTAQDFTLTDHQGREFRLSQMRGKIALLYFGFTACPDVCPTELAFVGRLMQALGTDANQVQPLFVTVDPQRDTAEVLAGYAPFFHPSLLGLRGDEAQIKSITAQFGIAAERSVPPGSPPGYYLIDHTSSLLVLDRDGRVADRLDATTPVPVALGRVRRLLAQ